MEKNQQLEGPGGAIFDHITIFRIAARLAPASHSTRLFRAHRRDVNTGLAATVRSGVTASDARIVNDEIARLIEP